MASAVSNAQSLPEAQDQERRSDPRPSRVQGTADHGGKARRVKKSGVWPPGLATHTPIIRLTRHGEIRLGIACMHRRGSATRTALDAQMNPERDPAWVV